MTDTDKLKRLADEVLSNSLPVCAEYTLAQAILALIAENGRLREDVEEGRLQLWMARKHLYEAEGFLSMIKVEGEADPVIDLALTDFLARIKGD